MPTHVHGARGDGYIALVGAEFIGRIIGDRLVDRFGRRTVPAPMS